MFVGLPNDPDDPDDNRCNHFAVKSETMNDIATGIIIGIGIGIVIAVAFMK